jgi:hypothetical protein
MVLKPLTSLLVVMLATSSTHATIIKITGDEGEYQGSAAEFDLRRGVFETALVQGFDELQCVEVADGEIIVDFLVDDNIFRNDIIDGIKNYSSANGRALPAGTYTSHLLHYDPPSNSEVGGGVAGVPL